MNFGVGGVTFGTAAAPLANGGATFGTAAAPLAGFFEFRSACCNELCCAQCAVKHQPCVSNKSIL